MITPKSRKTQKKHLHPTERCKTTYRYAHALPDELTHLLLCSYILLLMLGLECFNYNFAFYNFHTSPAYGPSIELRYEIEKRSNYTSKLAPVVKHTTLLIYLAIASYTLHACSRSGCKECVYICLLHEHDSMYLQRCNTRAKWGLRREHG